MYYNTGNSFTNHGLNFCGFDEKVSKIHKLVANDPTKTICYYKLQFTDPLITWINLKNRYSFNTDETTGYEFLLRKQMQKNSGFQYYKK